MNFTLKLASVIAAATVTSVRPALEAAGSVPVASVAATIIVGVLLLRDNRLFALLGLNLN
jgi:hypothetical protein